MRRCPETVLRTHRLIRSKIFEAIGRQTLNSLNSAVFYSIVQNIHCINT